MLTDSQITMAEAVYLAIDSDKISPELCQGLVDCIYQKIKKLMLT